MIPKNQHTLIIDKLIPGGLSLGRLANGLVILVRGGLPGEQVLVRETQRKKDYIQGALEEVLSASEDRRTPPCPIYGRCGGCDLQHAGPEAQLRLKKGLLVDSLERAASHIFHDISGLIETPVAAPAPFKYRQRVRLQVDSQRKYGFFQSESHDIVPVSSCLLAKEPLNLVLAQLHRSNPFHELIKQVTACELLFNPDKNNVFMLLHFQRKPRPADDALSQELLNHVVGLTAIYMAVEGYGLYDPITRSFPANPPTLSYTTEIKDAGAPLTFTWEIGSFCQVNLEQNSNLIKLVLEMTADGRHQTILDLYCGYGNFSLPAAGLASKVLGIDTQNGAIRSGIRNAGLNNILNCSFEKNQVPEAVAALIAAGNTYDTIILDPPRRGAPEIVALLPELLPDQIIYISCNPATLARDLATLSAAGYRLVRLVPVDMFPQTHHLETVAHLKR
jgi:23S rRNA (uracil1939-C5)-methyltransferase